MIKRTADLRKISVIIRESLVSKDARDLGVLLQDKWATGRAWNVHSLGKALTSD